MQKQLSVVIPAYNEGSRIKNTLKKITQHLERNKYNYELIVVDDASTDTTKKIVQEILVKNKKIRLLQNRVNKGKGYSIRKGVLNSRKPFILFSDADLSTPIGELDTFRDFLNEYDIIIGSRRLPASNIIVKQPFYREFIGRFFNLLVHLLILRGVNDTQCGFKLFKKNAAMNIFQKQRLNGFGFDVEILFLAKKFNYKIKEIPVTWKNSAKHSKVSIMKHSIMMFFDLLRIRFNSLLGLY